MTLERGERMRSSFSWDKPEGKPDLIARKTADWSLFRWGTHIPLEFLPDFEEANGNYSLKRGEAREVVLLYQDRFFQAIIRNLDRKTKSDTVQIRFDSNQGLKDLLREELEKSYKYLEKHGPITRIPEDIAEYVEFFKTGVPFVYRIGFLKTEKTTMSQDK